MSVLSQLAEGTLRRTPVEVLRRLLPSAGPEAGLIGVNYHAVADRPLAHIEHVLQYKSTSVFEHDLQQLEHHFDAVGYDDIERAAVGGNDAGRRRRSRSMVLTFDDGYAECHSIVRPILRERGMPCVFFVIAAAVDNQHLVYPNKVSLCIDTLTSASPDVAADRLRAISGCAGSDLPTLDGAIRWLGGLQFADVQLIDDVGEILGLDWARFLTDHEPYMTSDQIRQLANDGFTIGAHSVNHPYLRTLNDPAEIEHEIVESCRAVQRLTGQERVPFAFPFSADGLDRSFLEGVKSRHELIGLLFNTRGLMPDSRYMINRVAADGGPHPLPTSNVMEMVGSAYRAEAMRRLLAAKPR